eukprot:jgi/Tetstr1/432472/TSEL_021848.t1
MSQVATRAKSMAARSLQTRDFALTLPVPTLGLLGTEDCREDVGAVQGSCAAAFGLSVPCCDALEAAVANGCWCPPFPGGALLGGFLEVSDEAVQSLYDDLELQCGRTFDWPGEDDC